MTNINEKELRKVVGGCTRGGGGAFTVGQEEINGHMGARINMYDAESYIGRKVIVLESAGIAGYGASYYIGVIEKAGEEKANFIKRIFVKNASKRVVRIAVNNGHLPLDIPNPRNMWLYV